VSDLEEDDDPVGFGVEMAHFGGRGRPDFQLAMTPS
jgi:hypothetical protein